MMALPRVDVSPDTTGQALHLARQALTVFWAVLGLALGLYMGRSLVWGAWAHTDSVAYVEAARHLARGMGPLVYGENGALEWLAHFPPFYPFTLSLFMRAGLVWHQATRWDSALAYGLSVVLLGLVAWHITHRLPDTLIWTLLLALTPALVLHYAGAMSEGWFYLFMWLTLFGWWWALAYGRPGGLGWAGLAAGLALWTRYAGFFLAGGVVFLLARYPGGLRARVKAAACFLVPLLGMYLLWWTAMWLNHTGLRMARHSWAAWGKEALALVRAWPEVFWKGWLWQVPKAVYAPVWVYWGLPYLLLAAVLAVGLAGWWRTRGLQPRFPASEGNLFWFWAEPWTPERLRRWWLWAGLAAWSALGYLAFLYITHMLRDPAPDFNPRVLSPAFFLGWAALLAGGLALLGETERIWPRLHPPLPRTLWMATWTALALAGILLALFPATVDYLMILKAYGGGYTRKIWHNPEFWAHVKAWQGDTLIIASEANATRLWIEGYAAWPKEAFAPHLAQGPLGSNPKDPLHRAFREGRAVYVFLWPAAKDWWQYRFGVAGYRAFWTLRQGLPICWENELGRIYFMGQDPVRCPHPRKGP